MSNEQWKTSGDCSKCRREKYCSRQCQANRKAMQRFISRNITTYLIKKSGYLDSE